MIAIALDAKRCSVENQRYRAILQDAGAESWMLWQRMKKGRRDWREIAPDFDKQVKNQMVSKVRRNLAQKIQNLNRQRRNLNIRRGVPQKILQTMLVVIQVRPVVVIALMVPTVQVMMWLGFSEKGH